MVLLSVIIEGGLRIADLDRVVIPGECGRVHDLGDGPADLRPVGAVELPELRRDRERAARQGIDATVVARVCGANEPTHAPASRIGQSCAESSMP